MAGTVIGAGSSAETPCPACSRTGATVFLVRRGVPVHQHAVFADQRSATMIARGDLEMTVCHSCGFVFNRAFNPANLSYGEDYDNNQICSPHFSDYVDRLVAYLLDDRGLRGGLIVEVGCGKGYFLEKLIAGDATNRGVGFDPTYIGPLELHGGRLTFERRFYGSGEPPGVPAAVICRHVIEHLIDPVTMLSGIRRTLEGAPDATVYFETPCVEWILRNAVVWDFFYEHCSLFTSDSITRLFERCGFEVLGVRHEFDGQYLWIEARPSAPREVETDVSELVALTARYAGLEKALIDGLRTRIAELHDVGGVAIWGAGAKGVTFAHLVDVDRTRVDCVVDLNPRKQGHFVPGTGHPIVDYRTLPQRRVRSALVMNPNYVAESQRLIDDAGIDVRLYTEASGCA